MGGGGNHDVNFIHKHFLNISVKNNKEQTRKIK